MALTGVKVQVINYKKKPKYFKEHSKSIFVPPRQNNSETCSNYNLFSLPGEFHHTRKTTFRNKRKDLGNY